MLRKFDQKTMLDFSRTNVFMNDGLDYDGYIFYPKTCTENNGAAKCKIHFSLHGCSEQVNGVTGWDHINRNGLNEYAVTNNLIIVYPQVAYTLFKTPCFDFYGDIDSTNYLYADSIQGTAFMNMIKRLVEPMDTRQFGYDYGSDTNMNEDSALVESWKEFWRIFWNFPGLANQWFEINLTGFLVGLFGEEKKC